MDFSESPLYYRREHRVWTQSDTPAIRQACFLPRTQTDPSKTIKQLNAGSSLKKVNCLTNMYSQSSQVGPLNAKYAMQLHFQLFAGHVNSYDSSPCRTQHFKNKTPFPRLSVSKTYEISSFS